MSTKRKMICNNYRASFRVIEIEFDDDGYVQKALDVINKYLERTEEIKIEDPREWDSERLERFKKYGDKYEKEDLIKHEIFKREDVY